ncbi:putative molybdenum carrier protein [Thioalkalivibrio sp. XN8]|uniref:YpsA SLOG family protein n=1 Tax=Thioalkalivibrio sp. XN8 TaxID=2712863 RepID=UPI0013EBE39E|nr:hypothetical protein [Thioalkalivibrio sp. XN8]
MAGPEGKLHRIVSGGQTGVDRGALEAALAAGFPCGGWCPEGRVAEDGVIPERYPLRELRGGGYAERTVANVRDSDGTLVVHFGPVTGGTRLTVEACERVGRPCLLLDGAELDPELAGEHAAAFVQGRNIEALNVAGPRESGAPGAAGFARKVVAVMLARLGTSRSGGSTRSPG